MFLVLSGLFHVLQSAISLVAVTVAIITVNIGLFVPVGLQPVLYSSTKKHGNVVILHVSMDILTIGEGIH